MKPIFKHLLKPLRGTFLTLLFTVPQIPLGASFSDKKVWAQAQATCPGGTQPGTFEWTPTNNLAEFLSQELRAIGVQATFAFTDNPPPLGTVTDTTNFGAIPDNQVTRIDTATPSDIYGNILGSHLRWNIGLGKEPARGTSTLTITFSQPVTLATPLTFVDVDRDGARDGGRIFQDKITVTAFNGTASVPITGTAVSPNNVRVTNNGNNVVAEGINENAFNNSTNGNVQVTSSGAVNQIRVTYEAGTEFGQPLQDESIGLAKISICIPPGSIGDTVFNDINANNTQDPGEPGISGVVLNARDSNGNIVATTTTDSNGKYSFPNLAAGQYTVSVSQPPNGFAPTLTQPNAIALSTGQNYNQADFGFTQQDSLRLVKRITAIARTNGQRIQYNSFVDDPNDPNDNAFRPAPLGQYEVQTPLTSGDEVEYTIYFRTDQSLENFNFCDLIPAGTTYVPNSISLTGGGTGADQGRFFSPLTSLEQIPESSVCENRNNPNGTVIVKLGNIPTAQSGSVSFRVKIN